MFLEDLFVEPAHRGAGIGLALLRHLAIRAVAENCKAIEWRVLNWNQPAIDFYQRLGAAELQGWQTRATWWRGARRAGERRIRNG